MDQTMIGFMLPFIAAVTQFIKAVTPKEWHSKLLPTVATLIGTLYPVVMPVLMSNQYVFAGLIGFVLTFNIGFAKDLLKYITGGEVTLSPISINDTTSKE